jgi:hypothetical protein
LNHLGRRKEGRKGGRKEKERRRKKEGRHGKERRKEKREGRGRKEDDRGLPIYPLPGTSDVKETRKERKKEKEGRRRKERVISCKDTQT